MDLITDTAALAAFCEQLAGADAIAVDTEFMRERTFWPKLCLVQVAGRDQAAAIDPLSPGMDLAPLVDLLANPQVVKVFHAARQDLEIFFHVMGRLPAPVFDTQIAAMVCGFGDQAAYETLVAKIARAKVDKGSRFTDWSIRPLSPRQIDYALGDVIYLPTIYRKLQERLSRTGRGEWLAEEMAALTDPRSYAIEPADAYRRIKYRGGDSQFLAVLREVAAWREREAQARDLPRSWVVRDEALIEIAHQKPRTVAALSRTRGLARKFAEGEAGAALLAAVERGLSLEETDWPRPEPRREVPRSVGPVADLLKVLLRMKCDEAGVAQRLVASAEDIETLAALGHDADVPALHGWRRHLFGEEALRVRTGELALAVDGRRMVLVPRSAGQNPEPIRERTGTDRP